MATFAVEIRKLEKVWEHTNADALELAKVEDLDFQFVVQKSLYKEGDYVVYFPVDSILPDDLIEFIDMVGKFSGRNHNRVKTIKLRGEISQGFVIRADKIVEFLEKKTDPDECMKEICHDILSSLSPCQDISENLGVTKFEPEVVMTSSGNLNPLPMGLTIYDIEGCDRYTNVTNKLIEDNEKVWISEKLEGTNFSCCCRFHDEKIFVNTRRHTIIEIEEKTNSYWDAARKIINGEQNLIHIAHELALQYKDDVTIRGEMIGPSIQKNIYKLNNHVVYVFDIQIGRSYLNVNEFFRIMKSFNIENWIVPTIVMNIGLKDWLDGESIKEVSNRMSILTPSTRAEGIVIKPMEEKYSGEIGRLILKQRSPEYLAKYDF